MILSFSILKPNLGKSLVSRDTRVERVSLASGTSLSLNLGVQELVLGSPLLPGINISKSFSLYQSLGTCKTCLHFQGRG